MNWMNNIGVHVYAFFIIIAGAILCANHQNDVGEKLIFVGAALFQPPRPSMPSIPAEK